MFLRGAMDRPASSPLSVKTFSFEKHRAKSPSNYQIFAVNCARAESRTC